MVAVAVAPLEALGRDRLSGVRQARDRALERTAILISYGSRRVLGGLHGLRPGIARLELPATDRTLSDEGIWIRFPHTDPPGAEPHRRQLAAVDPLSGLPGYADRGWFGACSAWSRRVRSSHKHVAGEGDRRSDPPLQDVEQTTTPLSLASRS